MAGFQVALQDVHKLWDRAGHNAFTDLVRYDGRFYCSFREATDHHSRDGTVRVLTSTNGRDWSSSDSIGQEGWDLRDPKLSIRPDGTLLMHVGARGSERRLRTWVYASAGGTKWHLLGAAGDDQYWLWGVSWIDGMAYGVGYKSSNGFTTRLYGSEDGVEFSVVLPTLFDQGRANEARLLFQPDRTALCLVRRDADEPSAQLGVAPPPYKQWEWKDLGTRIGGQAMLRLNDGRIVVATRLYDEPVRTSLCWLDASAGTLTEFLPLPSGGDTSYPGLVWHDGLLWVSYYSSHEGKSCIYIATVPWSELTVGDE